jgi:hypothetical protein
VKSAAFSSIPNGAVFRERQAAGGDGLARAGNARVRRAMIQLAWRFLMFQKESALALWYRARTADSRSKAGNRPYSARHCVPASEAIYGARLGSY